MLASLSSREYIFSLQGDVDAAAVCCVCRMRTRARQNGPSLGVLAGQPEPCRTLPTPSFFICVERVCMDKPRTVPCAENAGCPLGVEGAWWGAATDRGLRRQTRRVLLSRFSREPSRRRSRHRHTIIPPTSRPSHSKPTMTVMHGVSCQRWCSRPPQLEPVDIERCFYK